MVGDLMTTICDLDPAMATALRSAVGEAHVLFSLDDLRAYLDASPGESTVVLGPSVDQNSAYRLAETMRVVRPSLGVVLVRTRIDTGILAEALRAGVREVVDERDLAGLNAAVRRSNGLAAAMRDQGQGGAPLEGRGPRGKIITVFSAKGGCGKTTLATNLAAALADRGRREVCLVDLDLAFGDVAIALQLFPAHTIADAVPLADNLDFTAVQALLTPHSPGLTTLVAPVEPGSAESIPAVLVSSILELLREHFDYVVVDTPPAFDDQVLAAFDLSDVVALIATLDIPALKNLKLTLETMDLLNYPRDRWRHRAEPGRLEGRAWPSARSRRPCAHRSRCRSPARGTCLPRSTAACRSSWTIRATRSASPSGPSPSDRSPTSMPARTLSAATRAVTVAGSSGAGARHE